MQIHKLQMQCIFGCDVRGRESRGGERLARNFLAMDGWRLCAGLTMLLLRRCPGDDAPRADRASHGA